MYFNLLHAIDEACYKLPVHLDICQLNQGGLGVP
jgi:hypothetical protein